eukprot:Nk52_evm15s359 gene=Nk52_evmTU15s359
MVGAMLRTAGLTRMQIQRAGSRGMSTASTQRVTGGVAEKPMVVTKRAGGGFRSALLGFMGGLTIAGGVGYVGLFEDITASTGALNKRLDEVHATSKEIKKALDKIHVLEEELGLLKESAARMKDIEVIRDDLDNSQNHMSVSFAQHKASMWEMQKDLYATMEKLTKELGNQASDQ